MAKVEALPYDDRTVYSVSAFNRGVAQWLTRLPTVWVEGEITELRRHERWATVFFTLKDPAEGVHTLAVREGGPQRVEPPARHRHADARAVGRILEREEDGCPSPVPAERGDLVPC